MLDLYLDTLIVGHKCCSMLSVLNELTLQTQFKKCMTNNVFWSKKENTTTTTKQKQNEHKNIFQRRTINTIPLAPQSDALHLDHQGN